MNREHARRFGHVCGPLIVLSIALAPLVSAAPPSGEKMPAPSGTKAPPPPKPGKMAAPKPGPGVPPKGGPTAGPPGYGYQTGFIERQAKRLELSDETVKALRAEVEKSRGENERIRKEVEAAQLGLRKLLEQDLPDEKAVMDQADKITALVGEQRKNQLRSAIKVRSMLTPKQRAELEKIRKEQAAAPRRGGPGGHGGPGGPPPHGKQRPPFGAGPHGKPPPPKPQPDAAN
jgi:Spy/CpxP family protein refolding chaperone